jgi:uncharacterized protein YwqG
MTDILKWLFGSKSESSATQPAAHLDEDDPRVPGFPPELLPYHKALEATRRPILAAELLEGMPERADSSILGGHPWWPANMSWPTDASGRPLQFLMQVNFDDAPVLDGFPDRGLLQFFIGRDDVNGANFDDPKAPTGFACIYHPATDGVETSNDTPPPLEETDDTPLTHPDVAVPLAFSRNTMLIDITDYRFDKQFPEIANDDHLVEAYDEFTSDDTPSIRLGGYPTFAQQDPREHQPGLGDVTLLTIDSSQHIMWGDVGVAQFFIEAKDLSNRDFSRVAYNWDCG